MASEKILHAYDNGILPDHSFAYGGDRRRRFPSNSFWPKGPYIIAALSLLFNLYSVFNQMYLSTEVLYSHRSRYGTVSSILASKKGLLTVFSKPKARCSHRVDP